MASFACKARKCIQYAVELFPPSPDDGPTTGGGVSCPRFTMSEKMSSGVQYNPFSFHSPDVKSNGVCNTIQTEVHAPPPPRVLPTPAGARHRLPRLPPLVVPRPLPAPRRPTVQGRDGTPAWGVVGSVDPPGSPVVGYQAQQWGFRAAPTPERPNKSEGYCHQRFFRVRFLKALKGIPTRLKSIQKNT